MPSTPPSSFGQPAPAAYLSPYPAPSWWPTGDMGDLENSSWPTWASTWPTFLDPPIWPPPFPPPDFPPETPPPPQFQQLNNEFEQLCCIGYNPEDSMLEAIITIKLTSGYGGTICTPGSIESVGFWLAENSGSEPPNMPVPWPGSAWAGYPGNVVFIGEKHVHVFDIPRTSDAVTHGELKYAVRLQLTPPMAQYIQACANANVRLPRLHAVHTWNQVITDMNFLGAGLFWGSIMDVDIQYPKIASPGDEWRIVQRQSDESKVWPMHVALLKNRKVLMFSGSGNIPFYPTFTTTDANQTADLSHTCGIFDPDSETITEVPNPSQEIFQYIVDPSDTNSDLSQRRLLKVRAESHDVFCSGHSVMHDGRVMVLGGTESYTADNHQIVGGGPGAHHGHFPGLQKISIFDSDSSNWVALNPHMAHGRWYPSSIVQGDGTIFFMDGHTDQADLTLESDGLTFRHNNNDLEIWDPYTSQWHYRSSGNAQTGDPGLYPRLHVLPDGSIFSSTTIFTDPQNSANNNQTCRWHPDTETWSAVTGGNGMDIHQISVLLPILASPSAPTYDPTGVQVLILDGATPRLSNPLHGMQTQRDWHAPTNPRPTQVATASRINGHGVILPDATVLLVGGIADTGNNDANLVAPGEIYDPVAQSWKLTSPLNRALNYHSVALLLYDGRVLAGGSNFNASQGSVADPRRDLTLCYYTPDYLWRGPRPVFANARDAVSYGETLRIRLDSGWHFQDIDASKIGLIRLYSVTHAHAFDQRYVGLLASKLTDPTTAPAPTDREFFLKIPTNQNLLPPGYYMLFLLNKAGCPSLGHIIHVG